MWLDDDTETTETVVEGETPEVEEDEQETPEEESGETPPSEDETPAGDESNALKATLKKVRRELKAAQSALKEHTDKDKSEAQREKERADAAEQRADQLEAAILQAQVRETASNLGIIDADLAFALLDSDILDAEENGGVEAAVKDLKKRKPHLFETVEERRRRKAAEAGGPTNGRRQGEEQGPTPEQVGKMSRDERKRLRRDNPSAFRRWFMGEESE